MEWISSQIWLFWSLSLCHNCCQKGESQWIENHQKLLVFSQEAVSQLRHRSNSSMVGIKFRSFRAPRKLCKVQTHKLFAFFRAPTIILEKISKLFTDALILEYKYQWLVKMIPCCIKDAKAKWGSIMVFYVESKTRISDTRNLHLVNNNRPCW